MSKTAPAGPLFGRTFLRSRRHWPSGNAGLLFMARDVSETGGRPVRGDAGPSAGEKDSILAFIPSGKRNPIEMKGGP